MQAVTNRLNSVLLLLVLLAVATALSTRAFGGPLDPPAAPAPTGKVQILSLPYTISSSGSYILNSNLTGVAGSDGITVSVDSVTIDLNGFTLIGPGGGGSETGINNISGWRNLTVRNGALQSWGGHAIEISGNYSGGANARLEDLSIDYSGYNSSSAVEARGTSVIRDITVAHAYDGLSVVAADVSDCTVVENTHIGIDGVASNLHGCTVEHNGTYGVSLSSGSQLSNSTVSHNFGDGVYVGVGGLDASVSILSNQVTGNSRDGIRVFGSGSLIADNDVSFNGLGAPAKSGIFVPGNDNRIDGNHLAGQAYGLFISGTGNTIVRNSARSNTTANYAIGGGNDAGPVGAAAVTTDPWANIAAP